MEEVTKKIKAVMIGHAVGDALGVPVEFCEREELDESPLSDMMGYGTYDVPAGAWSDDTSMSLAALDSLSKGRIDYFEIMQTWSYSDGDANNNLSKPAALKAENSACPRALTPPPSVKTANETTATAR